MHLPKPYKGLSQKRAYPFYTPSSIESPEGAPQKGYPYFRKPYEVRGIGTPSLGGGRGLCCRDSLGHLWLATRLHLVLHPLSSTNAASSYPSLKGAVRCRGPQNRGNRQLPTEDPNLGNCPRLGLRMLGVGQAALSAAASAFDANCSSAQGASTLAAKSPGFNRSRAKHTMGH